MCSMSLLPLLLLLYRFAHLLCCLTEEAIISLSRRTQDRGAGAVGVVALVPQRERERSLHLFLAGWSCRYNVCV